MIHVLPLGTKTHDTVNKTIMVNANLKVEQGDSIAFIDAFGNCELLEKVEHVYYSDDVTQVQVNFKK